MAVRCDLCGKHAVAGNNVSHSHRKTRRTWAPNIQKYRHVVGEHVVRLNACTRCMRTQAKLGA